MSITQDALFGLSESERQGAYVRALAGLPAEQQVILENLAEQLKTMCSQRTKAGRVGRSTALEVLAHLGMFLENGSDSQ